MGSSSVTFTDRLRCARNGSPQEQSELLADYRSYLRFLARDGIGDGLRSKVDASDLAQDVLIAAQGGLVAFRGSTERELMAWLRRMLANRIVDYARKYGGARRQVREDAIEDILYESSMALESVLAASASSPSQRAHKREVAGILADAIEQLRPDDQEVIRLRTMKGMSWEAVAERMNRSEGAARVLWVRALKKLRPLLEDRT